MENVHGRSEISIAKKVHRFTHARVDGMKVLYLTAKKLTKPLAESFEK